MTKKITRQLEESTAKTASILHAAADAVIVCDSESKIEVFFFHVLYANLLDL